MGSEPADWDGEITLGMPDQATIAFGLPRFAADGSGFISIPVRVVARGLEVESELELEGWGRWISGLLQYLDGLDHDSRGWSGVRDWSDDHDKVTFKAKHHSTLLATLTVVLKHLPERSDGSGAWTAQITVPYEPAAMSTVARWMHNRVERDQASGR